MSDSEDMTEPEWLLTNKARAGRLVLAALDQNPDAYKAVIQEAVDDDTLYGLFDTLNGGLLGVLRLAIGDDNVRQWASDWVLHGSQG